ncbi:L-lactate MFS transporter [Enterococcus hulanensis]|uniref:L-lactate MFS transporter n=1 Tax=Enterococcus hulanensis TaxID=2559929 RepID=UPI0028BD4BBD|nr:OFA family MFS transporter [Enterococcus hulanensis]
MASKNNRWVMLAAHLCINFVLGGVYAFSFFKTSLLETFHWDPALLALAFSINMGIIPIPMILGGKMIDDGKGKLAIVIGCILFSSGFILSGFVSTLPMLLLTYGIIAGFGSGLAFTGNLNNILKFFPDKRGLVSGIVLSGVGIGTLICTKLAEFFLKTTNDISKSLLFLGIVYLIVVVMVQFFIKSAPAKDSGKLVSSSQDKDSKEMLKDNRFWIMFIVLGLGVFAGMVISSSSAQIGMEQFGVLDGALIVSLVSILNSVGRIVWGGVSDKLGAYRTLSLVYLLMAVSMMMLILINGNTTIFYLCALIIGFCYAGILSVFPGLTSQNFGMKNQGMNYGFMYFGFAVGAIFSPYITSAIAKTSHSYNPVFVISIVLLILGVILIEVLSKISKKVRSVAK